MTKRTKSPNPLLQQGDILSEARRLWEEHYISMIAAAKAQGRRLGGPDAELEEVAVDFGTDFGAPVRRVRRRRQASPRDEYATPFSERVAHRWRRRTLDAVRAALAGCSEAPAVLDVTVGDDVLAANRVVCVRLTWIACVHARGIAVVEGALTLACAPYPYPLPEGVQAYYGTWLALERTGTLKTVDGALYRSGPLAPWQHAVTRWSAMDRLLDAPPTLVIPDRPALRTQSRSRRKRSGAAIITGLRTESTTRYAVSDNVEDLDVYVTTDDYGSGHVAVVPILAHSAYAPSVYTFSGGDERSHEEIVEDAIRAARRRGRQLAASS